MGLDSNVAESKMSSSRGEGVVGEFGSDEVAGGEQRAKPHVAAVVAEAQVVAQHAARLTGFEVASET